MSNVSDIKPWFKEDFYRTLRSITFASNMADQHKDEQYAAGFAKAIYSLALAFGVDPNSVLSPQDLELLRKEQS